MINLEAGANKAVFTLYEKCQNIVNPYFTFRITEKDSNSEVIFTPLEDNSNAPWYWNSFTISVVSGSPGLTSGQINIPLLTQWEYEVFEMSTPYDLNLNNAIRKVETGLMTVGGTYSGIQAYTQSGLPTEVYRNQSRI